MQTTAGQSVLQLAYFHPNISPRFVDPTNDVSGLSRYLTALGILFDPEFSKVGSTRAQSSDDGLAPRETCAMQVILRDIRVTSPRTIEAEYTSGGYLREQVSLHALEAIFQKDYCAIRSCRQYFPWRPKVEAYNGGIFSEAFLPCMFLQITTASRAGHVTYSLNDQGLVAVQAQTWSISAFDALRQTFTPTSGPQGKPIALS